MFLFCFCFVFMVEEGSSRLTIVELQNASKIDQKYLLELQMPSKCVCEDIKSKDACNLTRSVPYTDMSKAAEEVRV